MNALARLNCKLRGWIKTAIDPSFWYSLWNPPRQVWTGHTEDPCIYCGHKFETIWPEVD